MLGAPPPPPPLDVPALREPGRKASRSRCASGWKLHRKNPACASCHQRMDPLGFSLENFDAVGKWRAEADGVPVDPTASLPDGTQFAGVEGLRTLSRRSQGRFRPHAQRQASRVCDWAAASSITINPPFERSRARLPRTTIAGRRSFSEW